eukprot:3467943-Amphidinium_carterae.1
MDSASGTLGDITIMAWTTSVAASTSFDLNSYARLMIAMAAMWLVQLSNDLNVSIILFLAATALCSHDNAYTGTSSLLCGGSGKPSPASNMVSA